jgi:hypothetical protein
MIQNINTRALVYYLYVYKIGGPKSFVRVCAGMVMCAQLLSCVRRYCIVICAVLSFAGTRFL